MRQTWTERACDAGALGLIAVMAVGLFLRLAAFPGLHGDEAWMGLFTERLAAQGLYTPHEMNTYTGPLFALFIKESFARFGPGVWSLRLPGAVMNIAAWLLFWRTARRVTGPGGGLAWTLLAAGSGIVFLKSRLAWEVYALQPLLLAAALWGALSSLDGGGRPAALVLFAASLLGVQNHFIFMSVPAALLVSAAVLYARRREGAWLEFLHLTLVNMVPCGLLFLIKPRLSEASWPAVKAVSVAVFWLAPLAALVLHEARGRWSARLTALFGHPRSVGAGRWAVRAFMLLLAAFFWFHWVALIEIQSGSVVLQRLASWRLPLWAEVPLFVWAAFLLSAAFLDGLERLGDGAAGLSPARGLLAVLPVAYAAVFVVFRNTSSVRYYIIPVHILILSLSALWARRPASRRPATATSVALGAMAVHGLCLAAVTLPPAVTPLLFRVGWHRERSFDFLDKTEFFSEVERAGACGVDYNENQLDVLLHFDRLARPRACVEGRRVRPFYRWGGPPPYIAAEFSDLR